MKESSKRSWVSSLQYHILPLGDFMKVTPLKATDERLLLTLRPENFRLVLYVLSDVVNMKLSLISFSHVYAIIIFFG